MNMVESHEKSLLFGLNLVIYGNIGQFLCFMLIYWFVVDFTPIENNHFEYYLNLQGSSFELQLIIPFLILLLLFDFLANVILMVNLWNLLTDRYFKISKIIFLIFTLLYRLLIIGVLLTTYPGSGLITIVRFIGDYSQIIAIFGSFSAAAYSIAMIQLGKTKLVIDVGPNLRKLSYVNLFMALLLISLGFLNIDGIYKFNLIYLAYFLKITIFPLLYALLFDLWSKQMKENVN
jgi:hypothetical protein